MKQKKLSNRERNKKNNRMVYVLDINGLPLMPTNRCGKVKHMLRRGEAKVVNLMPFTIQLQYEPKNHGVDQLHVSIDPGFGHIGISVTTEKKELYRSEILPETGMKKRLKTRRSYRRDRSIIIYSNRSVDIPERCINMISSQAARDRVKLHKSICLTGF